MSKQYTQLPVDCDIAECWIEQALICIQNEVIRRKPLPVRKTIPDVIDIHMNATTFADARTDLFKMQNQYSLFWINIRLEPDFADDEWCVSVADAAYGSKGA